MDSKISLYIVAPSVRLRDEVQRLIPHQFGKKTLGRVKDLPYTWDSYSPMPVGLDKSMGYNQFGSPS